MFAVLGHWTSCNFVKRNRTIIWLVFDFKSERIVRFIQSCSHTVALRIVDSKILFTTELTMDSKIELSLETWCDEFVKLWISDKNGYKNFLNFIIFRNLRSIESAVSPVTKKNIFQRSHLPSDNLYVITFYPRPPTRCPKKYFETEQNQNDTLWNESESHCRARLFSLENHSNWVSMFDNNAKPSCIGRYTGGRCYRRILKSHGKIPKHVESLITLAFHRLPFCLPRRVPSPIWIIISRICPSFEYTTYEKSKWNIYDAAAGLI